MSKPKTPNRVRSSELISLRRILKARIHELNDGTRWTYNDAICRKARSDKAAGIQECITEINYLLKQRK